MINHLTRRKPSLRGLGHKAGRCQLRVCEQSPDSTQIGTEPKHQGAGVIVLRALPFFNCRNVGGSSDLRLLV